MIKLFITGLFVSLLLWVPGLGQNAETDFLTASTNINNDIPKLLLI